MTVTGPVLELTGESTPVRQLLADVWRKRDLLVMLAKKDFSARYRSSRLGVLWSVFVPLIQGVVLAVVFTRIVRVPSQDDYVVRVIPSVALWWYFSGSLTAASTSIVESGVVTTRVYYPRLLIPAVTPAANLVAAGVSMIVAIGLLLVRGEGAGISLLVLPLAVLLVAVLALGLGALTSLLHVYFRDVRYLVQAGVLVWFYVTPVLYPLELADGFVRAVLIINPLTGPLQLLRFGLFGRGPELALTLATSLGWLAVFTTATLLSYARHDRIAVDRL